MKVNLPLRKTKILITVGPACSDEETLRSLMEAGVNGFRFNFSHGSMEAHRSSLNRVRQISSELDQPVACLADLQGPKIRVGELEDEPMTVEQGTTYCLYPAGEEHTHGNSTKQIPINYEFLLDDVEKGDEIYMNDGQIELVVEHVDEGCVQARSLVEGLLWSRKGVNIPGADLSVNAMTEKDFDDLEQIIKHDFDYVALSFVCRASDLDPARELLEQADRNMDLIAKIESRRALDHLDEIIDGSEGVIVARGDLGVEIGVERVPFHQKNMIRKANSRGKIVITATQMLESMIEKPVPTRAEVSDVSNAILDGSDVVMLSGETAVGDYPVRSVEAMAEIIEATESDFEEHLMELVSTVQEGAEKQAISMSNSAARVANEIDARAIVAPTASGFTARMVSNTYSFCPIIALSFDRTTRQKTALYRNVIPYSLRKMNDTDELIEASASVARELGYAAEGDPVVLLTGLPIREPGVTNFLHVLNV